MIAPSRGQYEPYPEPKPVAIPLGTSEREWAPYALCAQTDPEAYFPEKGGSTREAKQVCRACPVRPNCLEWALIHDVRFGVWGGLSERERRKLKRQANKDVAA